MPARFYDPKTLKPVVRLTLEQVKSATGTNPLISVYERSEGNLSIDDIVLAFILDNSPSATGMRKSLTPLVEVIKTFGIDISTRFGIDKYVTYSTAQLEADRAYWQSTLRAEKDYERLLSKGIDTANEKIEAYPSASLSKPEVQQSNIVFSRVFWNVRNLDMAKIRDRDLVIQPIVDGARLTNEDAYDVFALIEISGEVNGIPYLGFHSPNHDQYRVATVTTSNAAGITYPDRDEFTYKNISQSDLYSDLRGSTSFLSFLYRGVFCLLDLTYSKLILNRVHRDSEAALTVEIAEKLPFLRLEGLTHRRITARIISPIGGSIAYHVLFFDAMLNQSEYIGFKEEGEPQLLKHTKTFYLSPIPRIVNPLTDQYASIGDMYVVMMNRTAANSELVTLDSAESSPFELTRGTAYVEFTVYNISDSAMLRFAVAYLSRMVGRYYEVASPQYTSYISDEFHLSASLLSSTDAFYSRGSSAIRGIDRISHTYPEVFGHNYTRKCPHYPAVKQRLEPQDVEYQPATADEPNGGPNQWLKYPPDGGVEFYFRCGVDEPELKYPGVIVSTLRNRKRYPLLPCCFRTNQFKPEMRSEVAYRLGAAKASAVSEADITVASWGPLNYPPSFNRRMMMSSEKTLFRGRLGRIPQALLSIIRSRILSSDDEEDDEDDKVVRLGLSETNMVHAAFLAMSPEYQKLSMGAPGERLDYLRRYISSRMPHPACLYQELTASMATPEELMKENSEHPLFSSWTTNTHYRIIEEVLGINLYILMRVTARENAIEPHTYFFEVPVSRSGAPHMRRHSFSTRPSVILYRVRRFESGIAVDSGIELLIHGSEKTELSAVWGSSASAKIAELYVAGAQVLSFGTSPVNPSLYVACNGLYTADYASALTSMGFVATSQLIDERGLCRALTFAGTTNTTEFSVVFPGTQPYNLPFNSELSYIHYEPHARRIFGDSQLTSAARDGVFYTPSDDSARYIFVPLVRNDETLPIDLPEASYTPLTGLSIKAVTYDVHWRTAYTYLRVVLFLTSFLYAFAEPHDPKSFMEKHVVLDETRHRAHAREIYDFSGLKRVLVLREPVMREALAILRRLVPSFLDAKEGSRIVLTSQKIYDSIEYYVRTVHDQTLGMSPAQIRKRRWNLASVISPLREGGIPASQLLASDKLQDTMLSFGTPRAVRTWFRGIRSGAASGSMVTTSDARNVDATVRSQIGVILFRHPNTGRTWLIPAITSTLRNVTIVCYLWATQHRIIELEDEARTAAVADRLAMRSGESAHQDSRMTLMFRQKTLQQYRRSKSRILAEDDEEDLTEIKHLLDSENVVVYKYVLTRDNRIELLAEPRPELLKQHIVVEVLRTAPRLYTPMLSP